MAISKELIDQLKELKESILNEENQREDKTTIIQLIEIVVDSKPKNVTKELLAQVILYALQDLSLTKNLVGSLECCNQQMRTVVALYEQKTALLEDVDITKH